MMCWSRRSRLRVLQACCVVCTSGPGCSGACAVMHGCVGSQTMGGTIRWACDSVMRTVCKRPVHATSREHRRPPARWTDPASRPAAFWTNRTPQQVAGFLHTKTHQSVEKGRIHPFSERLVCAGVSVCWRRKSAPRCEPDALTRVPSTVVHPGRTKHSTEGSLWTS